MICRQKEHKSKHFLSPGACCHHRFTVYAGDGRVVQRRMGGAWRIFGSLIMWIGISIDWPSMITLLALGLIPIFGFSGTLQGHSEIRQLPFFYLPLCWYIRFLRPILYDAVLFTLLLTELQERDHGILSASCLQQLLLWGCSFLHLYCL